MIKQAEPTAPLKIPSNCLSSSSNTTVVYERRETYIPKNL